LAAVCGLWLVPNVATATPTTPFTQCPMIGLSNSCGVVIVVNADRSVSVYNDSSVGPFDGTEDTLIGIRNESSQPVTAITAFGPSGLFGFDGDGLCAASIAPKPALCPFGSTTYEGPGTSFVTDPSNSGDGEIDFDGSGLAPGEARYFSLEGAVTAATLAVHVGHLTNIALGDSIAAGYGNGPSGPSAGGPSATNIFAYPALLASRLGSVDRDFAVEGAKATDVLAQICESVGGSVGLTQTGCTAPAPAPITPRFITLTVGANDVNFPECMTQALEFGPKPGNPCAGGHLSSALNNLKNHLAVDLAVLDNYYPNVPVIITGYYNPLGNTSGPFLLPTNCPLVTAAVAIPLTLAHNWKALFNYALELYARAANKIPGVPSENIAADALLSAFSRQILQRLNSTLANIASGQPNVTFVPLGIGSQGLCSSSPLIFEPQVRATYTLKVPFSSDKTDTFEFGQQATCVYPDPFEQKFTKSGSGTVSLVAGAVLDYSYSVNPNCLPHPTISGQVSIAKQVLSFLPPP
jgi:lysophospholipase L1-like esterase